MQAVVLQVVVEAVEVVATVINFFVVAHIFSAFTFFGELSIKQVASAICLYKAVLFL